MSDGHRPGLEAMLERARQAQRLRVEPLDPAREARLWAAISRATTARPRLSFPGLAPLAFAGAGALLSLLVLRGFTPEPAEESGWRLLAGHLSDGTGVLQTGQGLPALIGLSAAEETAAEGPGGTLALAPRTRLQIRAPHEVALEEGELRLASLPTQELVVTTLEARLHAVGARVLVQRIGSQTRVELTAGQATVAHRGRLRPLRLGQRWSSAEGAPLDAPSSAEGGERSGGMGEAPEAGHVDRAAAALSHGPGSAAPPERSSLLTSHPRTPATAAPEPKTRASGSSGAGRATAATEGGPPPAGPVRVAATGPRPGPAPTAPLSQGSVRAATAHPGAAGGHGAADPLSQGSGERAPPGGAPAAPPTEVRAPAGGADPQHERAIAAEPAAPPVPAPPAASDRYTALLQSADELRRSQRREEALTVYARVAADPRAGPFREEAGLRQAKLALELDRPRLALQILIDLDRSAPRGLLLPERQAARLEAERRLAELTP